MNNVMTVLNTMLKVAVDWEHDRENPVSIRLLKNAENERPAFTASGRTSNCSRPSGAARLAG